MVPICSYDLKCEENTHKLVSKKLGADLGDHKSRLWSPSPNWSDNSNDLTISNSQVLNNELSEKSRTIWACEL